MKDVSEIKHIIQLLGLAPGESLDDLPQILKSHKIIVMRKLFKSTGDAVKSQKLHHLLEKIEKAISALEQEKEKGAAEQELPDGQEAPTRVPESRSGWVTVKAPDVKEDNTLEARGEPFDDEVLACEKETKKRVRTPRAVHTVQKSESTVQRSWLEGYGNWESLAVEYKRRDVDLSDPAVLNQDLFRVEDVCFMQKAPERAPESEAPLSALSDAPNDVVRHSSEEKLEDEKLFAENPKEDSLEENAPEEHSLEETASEEKSLNNEEESALAEGASQENAPEEGSSEERSLQAGSPEKSSSQEAVSEEESPEDLRLVELTAGVRAAEKRALAQELESLMDFGNMLWERGDYNAAMGFYKEASVKGFAPAQKKLGDGYFLGRGAEPNYPSAFHWYTKAAEQGVVEAQCIVGECLGEGKGVEQDYVQAAAWYKKAAEQGDARAQFNLAACYYSGNGLNRNYAEALMWFSKGAECGCIEAHNGLGDCYYYGRGALQDYTAAVHFYAHAANKGYVEAQINLSNCYYKGEGVRQDYHMAVKWLKEAALQGSAAAQMYLGRCCYSGEGVPQNYHEAVEWLEKAAGQGHAEAQYEMGMCCYYGQGTAQDPIRALVWYRKAADQGHELAKKMVEELEIADEPEDAMELLERTGSSE